MNDQNSTQQFWDNIRQGATSVSPPKRACPFEKRSCCTLHVAGGTKNTLAPIHRQSEFTPSKTCNKQALNFVKNDLKIPLFRVRIGKAFYRGSGVVHLDEFDVDAGAGFVDPHFRLAGRVYKETTADVVQSVFLIFGGEADDGAAVLVPEVAVDEFDPAHAFADVGTSDFKGDGDADVGVARMEGVPGVFEVAIHEAELDIVG